MWVGRWVGVGAFVQWREKSNVRACKGGTERDVEEYGDKEWMAG